MFKNLSAGAIGIRGLSMAQTIDLAARTGFGGIDFSIREAADLAKGQGVAHVKALFRDAGIFPGQWGLPVQWNRDSWRDDLAELPALAALGQELGCTRTATWCPPASDELDYEANLRWHVDRFRPIAEALADHDCRLGIEFIGPKTLRDGKKHEFVYTLGGMMDIAEEIGTGNVGLLLDAWHLYTSGDTVDAMDEITAEDIVTVHVNDAPEGVALDEQIDNVRRLPMETGVIDLPAFMRKLIELEYDGPITPEPFSARTNEIAANDPLAAAQLVATYMDKLFASVGLD